MHKISLFLSLTSVLFGLNLFAIDKVELNDAGLTDYKPAVSVSNTSTYPVFSEVSGDGNSSSSPITSFIPLESSDATLDERLRYRNSIGSAAGLPLITTGGTSPVGSITFSDLLTSFDATDRALYLAINKVAGSAGTDYEIIKKGSGPTGGVVGTYEMSLAIDLVDLCASYIDCDSVDSVTGDDVEHYFYIFIGDSALTKGEPASPVDDSGLYYKLSLNTKLPDETFTITSIGLGDESLTLNFSSTAPLSDFREFVILDSANNIVIGDATNSSATALTETDEFSTKTATSLRIKHLENDRLYHLRIAGVDKYNFVTLLSNEKSATPLDIGEFLSEESCYLLSAGFAEKHFIIDYFKMIRDDYLLENDLGKRFVSFYYATAPDYTHFIYKKNWVSMVVRGAAYSAYYLFNYFYLILALLAGFIFFIKFQKTLERRL